MAAQPLLFPDKPKKVHLTPEEEFRAFHSRNPEVFRELAKMALNMKREGFPCYSMRTLWEVLRWKRHRRRLQKVGDEEYELNDHYPPYYARLLMATYPALQGFFEVRSRKEN